MHAVIAIGSYTMTSGQLYRAYANTRANRYSTLQQLFIYTPVLHARNYMLNNVGRNKYIQPAIPSEFCTVCVMHIHITILTLATKL